MLLLLPVSNAYFLSQVIETLGGYTTDPVMHGHWLAWHQTFGYPPSCRVLHCCLVASTKLYFSRQRQIFV